MYDNTLLIPGLEYIRPEPDFERLRRAVLRKGKQGELPFLELFADAEIKQAILGRPVANMADEIEFWYRLGYDSVPFGIPLFFPQERTWHEDTAELPHEVRGWVTEEAAYIRDRNDFEKYPWPDPNAVEVAGIEDAARLLPDGMRFIVGAFGIFETVSWLMGYSRMCTLVYDAPDLIADMFHRIGEIVHASLSKFTNCRDVGAVFFGEDMGFKTATMLAPEVLRRHLFPWMKKIADTCHDAGKPLILHSCGNLEQVMDDLIDYVGIDAKHSFEDAIIPVNQMVSKYSKRIGIVGGVDVDFLSRRSEEEVREYVRGIIRECAPSGAYMLGTGNSVANYIKVENYLAMLEEGWRYRIGG